ncbi:uncharacterized protein (TIGR02679 family) [Cryobacterium sp. MP_3.1]|uniref:TIGR02679 family protein n=1 Tax=Cryobacterium sp. MP_3.1 TaxID=3071711 RepID=UPI002E0328D8|nr:uncharacterized protein (TIGR02679 family) [Cryobacterium sp. MP_3.1]
MTPEPEQVQRIRRLLDTPDTAWLLARLRSRLEQKGTLVGTVSKQEASTAERVAVARLLGRSVRSGSSASVPLDVLDARMRQDAWPDGLASAVIALTGPVVGPEVRRANRDSWHGVAATLRGIAENRIDLSPWVENTLRVGALKRATATPEGATALALQLTLVAGASPVQGEVLGVLASRLFDDAHALDPKTPLGSLAVGLAAAIAGVPAGTGARWRREAWQGCGVVVDELSSTVLVLGLPGGATSPTARALAALASAGQPAVLTYRQLATDDVGAVPPVVFVCENPAVIAAAADRFGVGARSGGVDAAAGEGAGEPASVGSALGAPIVCVNGQPGAAVIRLLTELVAGGAILRYHGDFDGGGLSIARTLSRSVPWTPWRFGEDDYRAACAANRSTSSFAGAIGETPWDAPLAGAMEELRQRVEEESVLAALLSDLGRHGRP